MKQGLLFALVSLAIIGLGALGLSMFWPAAADHRAIHAAAMLALAVQLVAFALARLARKRNVFAGWGLGVVLRFVVLSVFALIVVRRMGLPPEPAIISLALFLFTTTLVEPLFLKS